MVHRSLPCHSVLLAHPEQIEAIPLVLHCVMGQACDLDASVSIFSKLEWVVYACIFEQVIDLLIINLQKGALGCNSVAICLYLLEDVKQHPRYKTTLL